MSRRFRVGAGFLALRALLTATKDVKTLGWWKSHEVWVGLVFAGLMGLVAFGVVDFSSDEAEALATEAATAIVSLIGFVLMVLLRRYTTTKPLGPRTEREGPLATDVSDDPAAVELRYEIPPPPGEPEVPVPRGPLGGSGYDSIEERHAADPDETKRRLRRHRNKLR